MFRLQLLPFGFRCYANVGHSSVSGTTSTCVLAPHPPWLTLLGCNSCIPETSCASSITSQTVHGQLQLKRQSPLLTVLWTKLCLVFLLLVPVSLRQNLDTGHSRGSASPGD